MPAASHTADPAAASGHSDQGAKPAGRLLGLVRKLVAYGRELVTALRNQDKPKPSEAVVRSFGTINAALIIARITRGLALAAGLATRLETSPPARKKPPTNPEPPSPRPRRTRPQAKRAAAIPRRRPTPSEDDAALLRGLPSAEEIAEMIRRRPAGAVIVEICRDLGITTSHPLWREVRDAIFEYGGNLVKLLEVWFSRGVPVFPDRLPDGSEPPLVWGGMPGTSTGPP